MALFESNLILLCPVIFMLWHFIDVNEILWRNSFFSGALSLADKRFETYFFIIRFKELLLLWN